MFWCAVVGSGVMTAPAIPGGGTLGGGGILPNLLFHVFQTTHRLTWTVKFLSGAAKKSAGAPNGKLPFGAPADFFCRPRQNW